MLNLLPEQLEISTYNPNNNIQSNECQSHGVTMSHIPTGIGVQCHNFKSQIQNKESCLTLLRDKINGIMTGWAGKFFAEDCDPCNPEHTSDESLKNTYCNCVMPPNPAWYPFIREAIREYGNGKEV